MTVPRLTDFGVESWANALVFWLEGFLEEFNASGSGVGDVVGPASAVNERIAVFDGTSGKLIKDGGKLVTDFGQLTAANAWTAQNTFLGTGTTTPMIVGLAEDTAAPLTAITLRRTSASPANADKLMNVQFQGNNSVGALANFARIGGFISDTTSTSEDGGIDFWTVSAGVLATRWWMGLGFYANGLTDTGAGRVNATGYDISGTNITATAFTWTGVHIHNTGTQNPMEIRRTNAGATVVEFLTRLLPSGGGANGDIAQYAFNFLDNAANEYQGVFFRATQVDATNGSEDTALTFFTITGGAAAALQFTMSNGVVGGAATGGAMGVGTGNFTALYDDSVQILPIILGTAVAASGQTNIDFGGIPANVKRISVTFVNFSLSGTDNIIIQLGPSGGIETTGYDSMSADIDASETVVSSTTGIIIKTDAAADAISGKVDFILHDAATNTWVCSGTVSETGTSVIVCAGRKALAGVVTQLRIDTTGTNTFDAGAVNIAYD